MWLYPLVNQTVLACLCRVAIFTREPNGRQHRWSIRSVWLYSPVNQTINSNTCLFRTMWLYRSVWTRQQTVMLAHLCRVDLLTREQDNVWLCSPIHQTGDVILAYISRVAVQNTWARQRVAILISERDNVWLFSPVNMIYITRSYIDPWTRQCVANSPWSQTGDSNTCSWQPRLSSEPSTVLPHPSVLEAAVLPSACRRSHFANETGTKWAETLVTDCLKYGSVVSAARKCQHRTKEELTATYKMQEIKVWLFIEKDN